MTTSKVAAIATAIVSALIAVVVSYIVLGLCLGQLLEDVRPSLVPLVNIGAVAMLLAVGIATFHAVFRALPKTPGPLFAIWRDLERAMVHINLFLWLAMVGAMMVPAPNGVAKWTALTGLAVAALWEHSAVRGFVKRRRKIP